MTIKADTLTGADWFKSSYSNDQGGDCIEGARLEADWFKSSYSNDQGGECVEGAFLEDGAMAVRDSKDPHGPALVFTVDAWRDFTRAVKRGELPTA